MLFSPVCGVKVVTSNLYFDRLSTNGFVSFKNPSPFVLLHSRTPSPFVLSLSKDETSNLSFVASYFVNPPGDSSNGLRFT
jgi:hypothetical protein